MGVTILMALLFAQAAPEERSVAPREPNVLPVLLPALPANVEVKSTMGRRFRLVEARVAIDGVELNRRTAGKGQELEPQFRLYDGTVRPGWHTVSVSLVYEGRNVGIFTYMDDYKIRAESTSDFNFQEGGRSAGIEVLVYERPGANVNFEQRLVMEVKPAAGSSAVAATQAAR